MARRMNSEVLVARAATANAQAALDRATERVRELEALAAKLNNRLVETTQERDTLLSRLAGVPVPSKSPGCRLQPLTV